MHTVNRTSTLVRKMVEDGNLPQRLFCYQPIDPTGHTFDILRDKKIWFSKPSDFNDPFDCRVYPRVISEEFVVARAPESAFSRDFTRSMLRSMLSDSGALDFIKKATDDVMGGKGIKCFTPYPDNLLMWAHYADSHKGVCFEFDVLEDPEFFTFPVKVVYEQDYPKINFSNVEETKKIYSTKSLDWAYEQEIRVMKLRVGLHTINPSAIKSIILGCKTPQKDIDKIIQIISSDQNLQHIALKRAVPDKYSFKLNIDNYTPANGGKCPNTV